LFNLISELEFQKIIFKKFEGLLCLSNPKYDLYVDMGMRYEFKSKMIASLRLLMDYIFFLKSPTTIEQLSSKFDLEKGVVEEYILKWSKLELLEVL